MISGCWCIQLLYIGLIKSAAVAKIISWWIWGHLSLFGDAWGSLSSLSVLFHTCELVEQVIFETDLPMNVQRYATHFTFARTTLWISGIARQDHDTVKCFDCCSSSMMVDSVHPYSNCLQWSGDSQVACLVWIPSELHYARVERAPQNDMLDAFRPTFPLAIFHRLDSVARLWTFIIMAHSAASYCHLCQSDRLPSINSSSVWYIEPEELGLYLTNELVQDEIKIMGFDNSCETMQKSEVSIGPTVKQLLTY